MAYWRKSARDCLIHHLQQSQHHSLETTPKVRWKRIAGLFAWFAASQFAIACATDVLSIVWTLDPGASSAFASPQPWQTTNQTRQPAADVVSGYSAGSAHGVCCRWHASSRDRIKTYSGSCSSRLCPVSSSLYTHLWLFTCHSFTCCMLYCWLQQETACCIHLPCQISVIPHRS